MRFSFDSPLYDYINKGLELIIGVCVRYDLTSNYTFREAETSLRT